jgi:hypothetical protein
MGRGRGLFARLGVGAGSAYLDKQLHRGKDRVAALRPLRRRLSDAVFTALRADQPQTAPDIGSSRCPDPLAIGASRSSTAHTSLLIAFINEHKDRFGVEPICTVLSEHGCKISPSTSTTPARPPSKRQQRDAELVALVTAERGTKFSRFLGAERPTDLVDRQSRDVRSH